MLKKYKKNFLTVTITGEKLATLQRSSIYRAIICLPWIPLDKNRFFFLEEAGVGSPPLRSSPLNWMEDSGEIAGGHRLGFK